MPVSHTARACSSNTAEVTILFTFDNMLGELFQQSKDLFPSSMSMDSVNLSNI